MALSRRRTLVVLLIVVAMWGLQWPPFTGQLQESDCSDGDNEAIAVAGPGALWAAAAAAQAAAVAAAASLRAASSSSTTPNRDDNAGSAQTSINSQHVYMPPTIAAGTYEALANREIVYKYVLPPGVEPARPRLPENADQIEIPEIVHHPSPNGRVFVVTLWDCNEYPALGYHQIVHYRDKLGVPSEQIHVTLHVKPGRARYQAECENIIAQSPGVWFSRWTRSFSDAEKIVMLEEVKYALNITDGDWIVHLDGDELHGYPPGQTLTEYLADCDAHKISHLHSYFADRVAGDGSLPTVTPQTVLDAQFPLVCNVTKAISKGNTHKVLAFRAFIKPGSGGFHSLAVNNLEFFNTIGFTPNVPVYHFKWVNGVLENLRARAIYFRMMERDQHSIFAGEMDALVNTIEDNDGKICVKCPELGCLSLSDASKPMTASQAATLYGQKKAFFRFVPQKIQRIRGQ